jgi:hypothetical protein
MMRATLAAGFVFAVLEGTDRLVRYVTGRPIVAWYVQLIRR